MEQPKLSRRLLRVAVPLAAAAITVGLAAGWMTSQAPCLAAVFTIGHKTFQDLDYVPLLSCMPRRTARNPAGPGTPCSIHLLCA